MNLCRLIFLLAMLGTACGQNSSNQQNDESTEVTQALEYSEYRAIGLDASTSAQTFILERLVEQTSKNGFAQSIAYCNSEVSDLLTIQSDAIQAISRITSRPRNKANAIESNADKTAWVHFKNASRESTDTVIFDRRSEAFYYRPIFINTEFCLNCHGSRSLGVELETLEAIDQLYPGDPAVNYALGDLRGLWRIEFN